MDNEIIINEKAFEIGKNITSSDKLLICRKLNITESAVNKALSGKRRCLRGKSLMVIEIAEKLAKINLEKAELV